MRLCFNGFCLGPQRPEAVEQSSQTVLTFKTALDTLNVTTFFDKTSYRHDHNLYNELETQNSKPSYLEKITMINQEDNASFQTSNLDFNNVSTIFDNHSITTLPSQFNVDSSDSQNNNLLSSSSQIDLVKHDAVDALNNTVENIVLDSVYVNEGADINMQDVGSEQELTEKEKDLIKVIQIKEQKIVELNHMLLKKDEEIANLKSHLDKFQSVFSGIRTGAMGRKMGQQRTNIQQRQRIGISAEPQSESSMRDLLSVTFPKYEKEEPWVHFDFSIRNQFAIETTHLDRRENKAKTLFGNLRENLMLFHFSIIEQLIDSKWMSAQATNIKQWDFWGSNVSKQFLIAVKLVISEDWLFYKMKSSIDADSSVMKIRAEVASQNLSIKIKISNWLV